MKDTKQQSTISTAALASIFPRSERWFYQRAEAGDIPKPEAGQWPTRETLRAAIAYIDKGGERQDALKIQQTRLAKAQAQKLERQNKLAEGTILEWEVVLKYLNERLLNPLIQAFDAAPTGVSAEWVEKVVKPLIRQKLESPKAPKSPA
jgi:phage terminase Nu1 subunit (DNA packaging protein)